MSRFGKLRNFVRTKKLHKYVASHFYMSNVLHHSESEYLKTPLFCEVSDRCGSPFQISIENSINYVQFVFYANHIVFCLQFYIKYTKQRTLCWIQTGIIRNLFPSDFNLVPLLYQFDYLAYYIICYHTVNKYLCIVFDIENIPQLGYCDFLRSRNAR